MAAHHSCEAIDISIGSKGSHYDVASVARHVLKDRLRYVGGTEWQSCEDERWQTCDPRPLLRVEMCRAYIERAHYWQNMAEMTEDFSKKFDAQIKSQRLMEICLRMGNERYLQGVLKEARAFFMDDG